MTLEIQDLAQKCGVICMIFLRRQFSVMLLMTLSFELHAFGFYENIYFYVKIQNVFHIYQDKTKYELPPR